MSATRLSKPDAGKDDDNDDKDKDVENINSIFHRISVAADRPISGFLKVLVKKGKQRQIYIILISLKGQEGIRRFAYIRRESNRVYFTLRSKSASPAFSHDKAEQCHRANRDFINFYFILL
jgi:hypothetical protein